MPTNPSDRLTSAILSLSDELDDLLEKCSDRLLRIVELRDGLKAIEARLEALLPPGERAFRVFDRKKREIDPWWSESATGYVQPEHCKKAVEWRDLLNAVLREVDPASQVLAADGRNQFFVQADDRYRATSTILRIMHRASKCLTVVDPYIDASIFDYLDEIEAGVEVRLLTANKKPMLQRQLQQRPKHLGVCHARESKKFHDRFIALDRQELWHLGASINQAGRAATMISRIVDDQERTKVLAEIEQWWASGQVL